MRILASFILFAIAIGSFAQLVSVKEKPSFYLGKRGTIDVNINTQVGLAPMRSKDWNYYEFVEYEENKILPLYFLVNPEAEYTFAFNNKMAGYLRGAFSSSSRNPDEFGYDSKTYNTLYESGTPKIKRTTVGVGMSFYYRRKRAAIAPIGANFSFGLSQHSVTATHEGMSVGTYNYNTGTQSETISLDDQVIKFKYISLDYGFQTKELISSNVYIHYGITGAFNLNLQARLSDYYLDDDSAYKEKLESFARNSFALRDILKLKIGAGYVLH